MKRTCFILAICLLSIVGRAQFSLHSLTVCKNTYQLVGSFEKSKSGQLCVLTLSLNNKLYRKLKIGQKENEGSRDEISRDLKKALHGADLFPPCGGMDDQIYENIERVIPGLIAEWFPYDQVKEIDKQVIDDNTKFRLLQRMADNKYQLSFVAANVLHPFVRYDTGKLQYIVDWRLADSPVIRRNFDKLLVLYHKIPSTAALPALYLEARSDGKYELVYSDDEETGTRSAIVLSAKMGDPLVGKKGTLTISGVEIHVFQVNYSQDPPKKPNDDPSLREVL